ncbi:MULTISPECIES: PaaI family thioesterase [unclassified Acinetobacter]|uniref:PaaI family thioesterase n=1 Tax=unclassified Acinetobacter TaxID=196816 RepID=UPI0015D31771|nr:MULTISPECIES: PaaI family thioesterase [unclassified Acinetobacter]UUS62308.1 PaaI family thioesterase [Acinetobacter sp. YH16056_T]
MHATKQEIINFLKTEFAPSLKHCTIVEVGEKAATLIWHVTEKDLRPGNTVSGPTMMTLADFALYVAILGEIGIVGLAVTTNMNINFLRKPEANQDLIGECRLLKVGKSIIYGEVLVYSAGVDEPVAHITGSYSIPPKRI